MSKEGGCCFCGGGVGSGKLCTTGGGWSARSAACPLGGAVPLPFPTVLTEPLAEGAHTGTTNGLVLGVFTF